MELEHRVKYIYGGNEEVFGETDECIPCWR